LWLEDWNISIRSSSFFIFIPLLTNGATPMHNESEMNAVNYTVADMTIRVRADLPITEHTFARKLDVFRSAESGEDMLMLHHHFNLPDDRSRHVEITVPWSIAHEEDRWIYDGYHRYPGGLRHFARLEWNAGHTRGDIYHPDETRFCRGGLTALIGMATVQILLARVLADRMGCLIHASGVSMDGAGLLFVGHTSAGKSTVARQLRGQAELVSEDRVAVRRMPEGFRIYSTWCNLDMPDTPPVSSPLRAVFFLEKAKTNRAILLTDRREILGRLLSCLIKPFTDAEWWNKTLAMADLLIAQTPAYRLLFDRSGSVVQTLRKLL